MNAEPLLTTFQGMINRIKDSILGSMPDIMGAILLFFFGLLLAWMLRSMVNRLLLKPRSLFSGKGIHGNLRKNWIDPVMVRVLSGFIYWMVLFLFLTASTEILGLSVVTIWLSGIANYLPRLLIAILIGAAGYVGGRVLNEGVVRMAQSFGIAAAKALGQLARLLVWFLSLLIAVDLIGLDISLLVNIVYIVIAALLLGAALAFGLGAQTVVANILASYYVQKTYEIGQQVKIGSVEGRITEITPTALILQTSSEQVLIPAKRFNDLSSTRVFDEA